MCQKLKRGEGMEKIRQLRRYYGLTQTNMANILGVSLQTYWKKEKGETAFNDTEKQKIKDLFSKDFPNITIDDLFFA